MLSRHTDAPQPKQTLLGIVWPLQRTRPPLKASDADLKRPASVLDQGSAPLPDSNESFMNGDLGLGMAIPEEATAKLGPLPSIMGGPRNDRDQEVRHFDAIASRMIRRIASLPVAHPFPKSPLPLGVCCRMIACHLQHQCANGHAAPRHT